MLVVIQAATVLWPRLDDQEGAKRLAASGAIRETAFEAIDVAGWAACFLAERYAEALATRYKLQDELPGILDRTSDDPDDASRAVELLESIGRKRGALRAGGHVDLDRAADLFLRDLRGGKLGRISFERPEDYPRRRGLDERGEEESSSSNDK